MRHRAEVQFPLLPAVFSFGVGVPGLWGWSSGQTRGRLFSDGLLSGTRRSVQVGPRLPSRSFPPPLQVSPTPVRPPFASSAILAPTRPTRQGREPRPVHRPLPSDARESACVLALLFLPPRSVLSSVLCTGGTDQARMRARARPLSPQVFVRARHVVAPRQGPRRGDHKRDDASLRSMG